MFAIEMSRVNVAESCFRLLLGIARSHYTNTCRA